MPDAEYMPTTDATRIVWFNNFATKFAQYAERLGFTTADVANVDTDSATLAYLINAADAYKTEAQEGATYKRLLIDGAEGSPVPPVPVVPDIVPPSTLAAPGIIARTCALVERIKSSPVYSSSIGIDLDITVPGETVSSVIKPVIAVAASGGVGVATVRFAKERFDGISLEWKRGAESDFVVIGITSVSPLVHDFASATGGVTEVLQYRARFVMGSAPVGDYSSIVSVLVG